MAGTRAQQPLRFRQRKLQPKQPLTVLREDQIESEEYTKCLTEQETLETGVEKSEESEYHLQQAILAARGRSNKDVQNIVPAPPALETTAINYDEAYSVNYAVPHSYVRFSATVEECTGCQFDMNSDDDVWLKGFNMKRPANSQCSEDDFEKLMEYFENTADLQTPFAVVDNTVVSFETMQVTMQKEVEERARAFAKDIYDYWRVRRQCSSNRPLQPSLKFEVHQDADDGDPYVCFRRRDVRQTRKTRNRDVQSTEKLKKLRKELEEGRLLVLEALQSQLARREQIKLDRKIFEQRAKVRDIRLRLNIRNEDEDLVNQKPQKRKLVEVGPTPAQVKRVPVQPNGRPIEADLEQLADVLKDKENMLQKVINDKLAIHQKWNQDFIDVTRQPLIEDHNLSQESSFRAATAQYLITPPASMDGSAGSPKSPQPSGDMLPFRANSPSEDFDVVTQPSFRRRIGRSGRMWIDRRGVKSSSFSNVDQDVLNRWKYDSDDDDVPDVYEIDPYDTRALKYRATIPFASRPSLPTNPSQAGQTNGQVNKSGAASGVATRPVITVPTPTQQAT